MPRVFCLPPLGYAQGVLFSAPFQGAYCKKLLLLFASI